jgi:hypothetical protein
VVHHQSINLRFELRINTLVCPPGVFREVLKDLGHDLSAVVGILEEIEEGDVDPEEVAVVTVQVVRTLSNMNYHMCIHEKTACKHYLP